MEKIYGIYNGGFDMSSLDRMREEDIFANIEDFGGYIWRLNHDAADGRIELTEKENESLERVQYALEYLVYYTRKFGVTFSREPEAGKHIERSEDYNAWYGHWNKFFNSLSIEKMDEYRRRRLNNEDLSDLLPKTNWKGENIDNLNV